MPWVAPRKRKDWQRRLDKLLELVRACMSTAPADKEVTIHHLFYDGYKHE
jgi:hypothetical protein